MFSKDAVIFDSDHVMLIKFIVIVEKFQNLKFHTGLVLELLLILYDFDRNLFSCFVI